MLIQSIEFRKEGVAKVSFLPQQDHAAEPLVVEVVPDRGHTLIKEMDEQTAFHLSDLRLNEGADQWNEPSSKSA